MQDEFATMIEET